jgi:hypothetical protein
MAGQEDWSDEELFTRAGLARFYFGCVSTNLESQKHDFREGQDQCRKCGMQRSVFEDTHAPCPGKPYTINEPLSVHEP